MNNYFFDIFKRNFQIFHNDMKFVMSNYSNQMLNLLDGENNKIILVHPGGKELSMFVVYYLALLKKYKNFKNSEYDITHDLNIGDKVCLNNKRLGVYQGKKLMKDWIGNLPYYPEVLLNTVHAKIEFAQGSAEYIKESDFFQIKKYNGDASRLNKLECKSTESITGNLLKAFKMENQNINTLNPKSVLCIMDKSDIYEIVNETKLTFEKSKKKHLSQVIPLSYWSNSEEPIRFKGNRAKSNSVVKFTCSIANAYDMICEHEEIDELLIDMTDIDGIDFNTIEQIMSFPAITSQIIIMSFEKYFQFKEFFKDENFREHIFGTQFISEYKNTDLDHPVLMQQKRIIENYLNKNVEFTSVNFEYDHLFSEIYSKLKGLMDSGLDDENTSLIYKKIYGILNIFKCFISFNNSTGLNNKDFVKEMMEALKIEIDEINTILNKDPFIEVYERLKRLYKELVSANLLTYEIEKKIKYSLDKRILFIVQNNRMKVTVDQYVKNRFSNKVVECCTVTKISESRFYDSVFIVGVVPKNSKMKSKLFNIVSSDKITFICYEHMKDYLTRQYEYNMQKLGVERVREGIMVEGKTQDEISTVMDLMEKMSKINVGDTVSSILGFSDNKRTEICDCVIEFDEYIGFFKKKYKIYRVNRAEQELEYCAIEKLAIGDEIVILNDQFKSGSFIEEVVEGLLEVKDFREAHYEKLVLSKLWRESLINYKSKYELSDSDLFRRLQRKGLKKKYITYKNWIYNDYIVGPNDKEDYEIILSLCADIDNKDIGNDIYEACRHIRNLHIRLRSEIGKMIVASYYNEIEYKNELSFLNMDFMSKISVCEVMDIANESLHIPLHFVNSLKRKDTL